jgi:hypothetical protein
MDRLEVFFIFKMSSAAIELDCVNALKQEAESQVLPLSFECVRLVRLPIPPMSHALHKLTSS